MLEPRVHCPARATPKRHRLSPSVRESPPPERGGDPPLDPAARVTCGFRPGGRSRSDPIPEARSTSAPEKTPGPRGAVTLAAGSPGSGLLKEAGKTRETRLRVRHAPPTLCVAPCGPNAGVGVPHPARRGSGFVLFASPGCRPPAPPQPRRHRTAEPLPRLDWRRLGARPGLGRNCGSASARPLTAAVDRRGPLTPAIGIRPATPHDRGPPAPRRPSGRQRQRRNVTVPSGPRRTPRRSVRHGASVRV